VADRFKKSLARVFLLSLILSYELYKKCIVKGSIQKLFPTKHHTRLYRTPDMENLSH